MTPYKATLTQQASALVYDLRQRINPQYSDQRGTESCERKECADMIDSLLAELAAMREHYNAVIEQRNNLMIADALQKLKGRP